MRDRVFARALLVAGLLVGLVAGSASAKEILFESPVEGFGLTTGKLSAKSCGSEKSTHVRTTLLMENEGPFAGFWALFFDDVVGVDSLSGIYIEADSKGRLALAIEDDDYVELNLAIDSLLALRCGGTLLGVVKIDKLAGKVSKDRTTVHFALRARFLWVDINDNARVRAGQFAFNTQIRNVKVVPF
jgi:hypothetical protein